MNRYVKNFIHRGLIFGGFGPLILGAVLCIINLSGVDLALNGVDILLAILSTYVLAFVQAGASVFNQIEHWSIARSLAFHFSALFIVYTATYLVNSWIPFEPLAILFFCLIFVLTYFTVWITVYFSERAHTKRMNERIGQK